MWHKETPDYDNDSDIINEYKKIIYKEKQKSDSIVYMNVQIVFVWIIIVMSFMFKTGSIEIFSAVKENYEYFFETDTYKESTFSYDSFISKLEKELNNRYLELITVFNSKGSADIMPEKVSTEKYYPEFKAVTPAHGYVSSHYGIRKNPFNPKEKEFHTGIDIAAPKGSFIYAAFTGTVSDAAYSSAAGNYIRINSRGGISTFYAHNQFLFVKEGDTVVAGQVIASMGDTGTATGPHLHFEFISDGIRYNPVYVLDL